MAFLSFLPTDAVVIIRNMSKEKEKKVGILHQPNSIAIITFNILINLFIFKQEYSDTKDIKQPFNPKNIYIKNTSIKWQVKHPAI